MYIQKRWLVPGVLTVLLFGALLAVAMVMLGQRIPEASGASSAGVAAAEHRPVHLTAARVDPEPAATPPLALAAPLPPPPDPAVADTAPPVPQPAQHANVDTEKSVGTQVTTGGFGDIGMQFQDVTINAPITNVHISNQGNNNATNVAIGDQNVVVSRQKDLESNRSDRGGPLATASAGGERTTAASSGDGPHEKDPPPPEAAEAGAPKSTHHS